MASVVHVSTDPNQVNEAMLMVRQDDVRARLTRSAGGIRVTNRDDLPVVISAVKRYTGCRDPKVVDD